MSEMKPFGKNGEYGPYEVQEDNLPNFGQVTHDFIKRMGWSVELFGEFYGKLVKKVPYTKARIYQMIQDNAFPTDPKRRYVIAKLLCIPPILLGIETLEDLLERTEERAVEEPIVIAIKKRSLDIVEYQKFLKECWQQNRAHTAQTLIEDIQLRIANLHTVVLYAGGPQKKQMFRLLCQFHVLLAQIARDQQNYFMATMHLDEAIILAKEEGYHVLHAVALLQRGITFREQGVITKGNTAQKLAYAALQDFKEAHSLEKFIDMQLKGAIFLAEGDVEAYLAHRDTDFKGISIALNTLNRAYTISQNNFTASNEHFVRFNEERYHMSTASTLINIFRPKDALEHLYSVEKNTKSGKRRRAYTNVLYAQAYVDLGWFSVAIDHARDALYAAKDVQSTVNTTRIAKICDELKSSKVGRTVEVIDLGVEVMRIQYPHLFHR